MLSYYLSIVVKNQEIYEKCSKGINRIVRQKHYGKIRLAKNKT